MNGYRYPRLPRGWKATAITKHRPARGALQAAMLALVVVGLAVGMGGATAAVPDIPGVPHYFGPYPNWANSPLTLPDATVTITGDGTGATAVATVGAGGAITAIDVTNGGHGYSNAKVTITGSGTGATADPTIVKKGAIVAITVIIGGGGYKAPTVTISGGSGGTGGAATAYGGVDAVNVSDFGAGYTMPTVNFDLPDDPNGVQAAGHATCAEPNCQPANVGDSVTITGVVVDEAGSGYASAPGVSILNGTQFTPEPLNQGGKFAVATATLKITSVNIDNPGSGYTKAPDVTIADSNGGTGSGATATAAIDNGVISAITVKKPGSGYVTPGGMKKFVDTLPGLTSAGKNNLGQYIPVATADTSTFSNADYYVIALVQHRERMSSSLPANGTLLREYVQLKVDANGNPDATGVPLMTDLKAGGQTPVLMPNGQQAYGVDNPHFLGPLIVAQRDRAVRIVFYNLLPTGGEGDLYLPVDSTLMGAGEGQDTMGYDPTPTTGGTTADGIRNPECNAYPKPESCYPDNRATLHLHGGNTPWISDGTPDQWITPAHETTDWPRGVSVRQVPDMVGKPNVPDCTADNSGCQTFYYTNQQSARLMFYHDHAAGITRLNVYAGEAAGYVIRDQVEKNLIDAGTIPSGANEIPLVIQDRTFVPSQAQLDQQDPTWDSTRWGGPGQLWWHHVYMPAQNPADPGGMSAFGRWMYGPWFWPPAQDTKYGPIANPYYDSACDPNTADFCEPPTIPGTPNISQGAEQFNDTPIVNGTAYPTTTVQPQAYRLRILNAANDRFQNLQWYVADSTGTEVALKPAEIAAAQTDPNVFPTPDTTKSPAGPSWIQIGTEGGFLPAPVVIPNQPITWITDPTRFDFGNVDKHSLLLGPAERADVVVDFSQFKGKTLILYNDAPAAFPARVACYDYYTGGPDLSPACAPSTLPGYGPNTRTIMQVKVGSGTAKAFNLANLQAAFKHHSDGSGVFEKDQHPIIVGQAAYNSAYGTSFAGSGNCNDPNTPAPKCDGYVRINDGEGLLDGNPNNPDPKNWQPWKFNTLKGTLAIPLQPKAMHDEQNSSTFDEFGRMQANLGIEARPPTPGLTNVNLMPYRWPVTEIIDATNLPKGDVNVTPIASEKDGTQIWKITHNGVDTHPIHFHAYDVQLINRVTWDNIIIQPDANELGWKDTVRISPLEDTIVALRPVIPTLPFDLPNNVRLLNPGMALFNGIDPLNPVLGDQGVLASATLADAAGIAIPPANGQGEPVDIVNHLVNYGAEYVFHCHILSHEENDMMRPVSIALPPKAASGVAYANGSVTFTDNSINETGFSVLASTDGGTTWTEVGRLDRGLTDLNTSGATESVLVGTLASLTKVQVVAENTVGDTFNYSNPGTNEIPSFTGDTGFPHVTATSLSAVLTVA